MSYLLEVYRGKQKAEKKFGFFMLYQMMYPRLIAGPIERPQSLLRSSMYPAGLISARWQAGFS